MNTYVMLIVLLVIMILIRTFWKKTEGFNDLGSVIREDQLGWWTSEPWYSGVPGQPPVPMRDNPENTMGSNRTFYVENHLNGKAY